ncbi:enhancer of mRNA-decapping protein 3 [Drosophila kikkawai]|uniref:Enhancer of mRNA-decapping protein 3 n=1 Tax=Drosophila kikkawai TaxID=30033 RepID=A0A6P4I6Y4_DROKI|nr:enhancer of mRNA-decapping protein 3 [Drosophila kikkawai]
MGLTDQDWIGCAVSIACDEVLGVFQGLIKQISAEEITIVRAFRNGVPLRKQNAEVVLKCTDIRSIDLIEPVKQDVDVQTAAAPVINKPTPVKLPNFSNILGKQQQLQLQQQQQQKQQFQEQEHDLDQPLTPRNKANGHGRATASGGGGAGGASSSRGNYNSTLSDKMHQLKLIETNGSNGLRRTPQSSRANSAQQQPQQMSTTPNSVAAFFGNMIPAKVEVKLGATAFGGNTRESYCSSSGDSGEAAGLILGSSASSSRPIDIVSNGDGYYKQAASSYGNGNGNGRRNGNVNNNNNNGNGNGSYTNANGNGNGNGKNKRNRVRRESSMRLVQQTFGSEADDPLIQEDFDFEGNLALFDKQAIWDDIESTHQKPDVVRHTVAHHRHHQQPEEKYRHDENILASKPLQLRQIESIFDGSTDFVTDDGLIVPTIPAYARNKIELSADKAGLSLQRQIDILARGASDLAITLLGGARRLTPANNHQWPKIAIICDGVKNMRAINIGAATGRQLASHGLTVLLYVEQAKLLEQNISNAEIALFKATDNVIVYSVDALPTPDLVILSTNTANLSEAVKKWLSVNRASVLAVDPPPCGINDVAIKYSILPILPLNGISTATASSSSSAAATPTPIASTSSAAAAAAAANKSTAASTNNCGKLYLCNLGIPDKFYRDCGIKYKSPYGHKYVIPIHSKD